MDSFNLDDQQKDALAEVGNISMGAAATALSQLVNKKVQITAPRVSLVNISDVQASFPKPCVIVTVKYVKGLTGENVFIVSEKDALFIVGMMMGMFPPEKPDDLGEMELSAVSEAMNQMMGSSATAISTVFDQRIRISPPNIHYINLAETELAAVNGKQPLVQISFAMTIGSLADTEIMQILPLDFAKEMVATLMGSLADSVSGSPDVRELVSGQTVSAPAGQPDRPEQAAVSVQPSAPTAKATPLPQEKVVVQPVAFAPLTAEQPSSVGTNLDLLLDIPLEVTVELGRTKRLIKDVLELGVGSVIELDKLAGEPVDVVVNSKLVARGEVVVIDENFGVRITDILTPVERVKQLQ